LGPDLVIHSRFLCQIHRMPGFSIIEPLSR